MIAASSLEAQCPRGDIPAYSHNDYRNKRPLLDALALGYRGVEADVFMIGRDLRLGHDAKSARRGPTLRQSYLEPLQAILRSCQEITAGGGPFLLSLELKQPSREAYDSLTALLRRYPLLLGAPGTSTASALPLNIVLTGWYPPPIEWLAQDVVLFGAQYKLREPDAHQALLDLRRTDQHIRMVSVDYGKTIGRWWTTPVSREHWLSTLRAVRHEMPGMLIRVYNVPSNAEVFQRLLGAGVDLIGTKHLVSTRELFDRSTWLRQRRRR